MRVAAVDHFVISARRSGHLDHGADDGMHGLHLISGQFSCQLIQLCLDLQLLTQHFRRSTVGIRDRCLGHRDILQRQDIRVIVQSAGLCQRQLVFLAAHLARHGFGDLVQLVIRDLLVHRLDRDSDGNDALAIFFVDLIVKINVGVSVDLTFRLVQHRAADMGPVGRVAVHLFFQRFNVPDEWLALLLFRQVEILVALAQLINLQAILALHRERIGDVHCCVELFKLNQVRLERLVQRQHDLAGALIDRCAGKPAEHRDFLGACQTNPLYLGVGDILDVLFDLLVHRAVVGVHAAELEKLIDRHLIAGQLGIRRLDHGENVQHQLLLTQRKAVHCVLDQVVGFPDDRLAAAAAVGSDRGGALIFTVFGAGLGRRLFGTAVFGPCLGGRGGGCVRSHAENLILRHCRTTPADGTCTECLYTH